MKSGPSVLTLRVSRTSSYETFVIGFSENLSIAIDRWQRNRGDFHPWTRYSRLLGQPKHFRVPRMECCGRETADTGRGKKFSERYS